MIRLPVFREKVLKVFMKVKQRLAGKYLKSTEPWACCG